MEAAFGTPVETFVGSGKKDSKGREIGFTVGLNDNGTDFHVWVQASRRVGHDFNDFGVRQRSVRFASQEAATTWGYATARARIANLK